MIEIKMVLRSLSLLIAIVLNCGGAVDIEKYMKVCARNSPDVNDCLIDAVQYGISVMANGIKDLEVPPVDPYVQKKLLLEYKNNQVQVKMNNRDIHVIGLKSSTVRDARLRADEDSFHLEVDMYTPAVSMTGKYEGGGSYNALNITARGTYQADMTDLVYTWKLDGKPETINNDVYVRIKSFYMRPDVSSMKVHLTNDAPESKELTELGVRLVNENWKVLYRELLPFAMNNWDKIGTKVANKLFLKVPYNQLFPNN
ncbi:circadian clock-controlled protein daywake-like [Maniola jurtina]|uniref:circadian clock-controlled protein daywake-like n=1 Tax=Maniola jurtina TaxID=191418 RepID=UPI001E6865A8|nr:circadian clock-controlled protein daywake-like [Maniola jurtina]XP_045781038.1 circadian clock-controlled protein daywake-like [Maniola jurtina]